MASYRKRRLEPFGQRVRRLLRSLRGGPRKRQRVFLLSLEGLRAKQVVLGDASEAKQLEGVLQALQDTGVVPGLIARYGNEVWVEYVEGMPLDGTSAPPTRALSQLFRALYAHASAPGPATGLLAPIQRNLGVLCAAGLLSSENRHALAQRAEAWLPERIFRGFDYVDARPANVLATEDGLRIVDVESLIGNELVGTGAARAWLRWPGLEREELLDAIKSPGVPPFNEYADFLELRYLARWSVRCVLQRKPHLLDVGHFDALCARPV